MRFLKFKIWMGMTSLLPIFMLAFSKYSNEEPSASALCAVQFNCTVESRSYTHAADLSQQNRLSAIDMQYCGLKVEKFNLSACANDPQNGQVIISSISPNPLSAGNVRKIKIENNLTTLLDENDQPVFESETGVEGYSDLLQICQKAAGNNNPVQALEAYIAEVRAWGGAVVDWPKNMVSVTDSGPDGPVEMVFDRKTGLVAMTRYFATSGDANVVYYVWAGLKPSKIISKQYFTSPSSGVRLVAIDEMTLTNPVLNTNCK